MVKRKLVWAPLVVEQWRQSVQYMREQCVPDTTIASLRQAILSQTERLLLLPLMGAIAPDIPTLRRVRVHQWWLYYRITDTSIQLILLRHTAQSAR